MQNAFLYVNLINNKKSLSNIIVKFLEDTRSPKKRFLLRITTTQTKDVIIAHPQIFFVYFHPLKVYPIIL